MMRERIRSLSEIASILIERVENNFDSIIIVDSGAVKGTGKSTFSMDLAKEICKKKNIPFNIRDIVVFDPTNEKIVDKIKTKPNCFPIIVDETKKVGYNRNWNERSQKDLVIFLNVCRKFGKIVFLNDPDFWELDTGIRNIADFRVTIILRGIAIFRGKFPNPEAKDKWIRKETEEMINDSTEDSMNKDTLINLLRRAKNYLFESRFPEMDEKTYSIYEKMSKEMELESFYTNLQDRYMLMFRALIGLITQLKIHPEYSQYMTFPFIATVLNSYFRLRGFRSVITDSTLRNIYTQVKLEGLEKLIVVDEFINKNNNSIVTKEVSCAETDDKQVPD